MKTFPIPERTGPITVGMTTVLIALSAVPAAAQVAVDDATRAFLNPVLGDAARVEASTTMPYPSDEVFAAILGIVGARAESDMIRARAAEVHHYSEAYVDAVLAILDDDEDGGPFLMTSLIVDIRRRIVPMQAPETRERIRVAVERLLDDGRDEVRLEAYRTLAASGDVGAVDRLAASVLPDAQPVVPIVDALSFLYLAGGTQHFDAARPYLDDDRPEVQAAAATLLAADPESRPRVVAMVTDSGTDVDVRVAGVRSLARQDSQFESYAIDFVSDALGQQAFRDAAMKAMVGRMNSGEVEEADQVRFAVALESRLQAEGVAMPLRGLDDDPTESQALMFYLLENFPAVRRHYEGG